MDIDICYEFVTTLGHLRFQVISGSFKGIVMQLCF